jgi:hypothetical protein
MDLAHWSLLGALALVVAMAVAGFLTIKSLLRTDAAIDEAIGAATFLALGELRERFERGELPRR